MWESRSNSQKPWVLKLASWLPRLIRGFCPIFNLISCPSRPTLGSGGNATNDTRTAHYPTMTVTVGGYAKSRQNERTGCSNHTAPNTCIEAKAERKRAEPAPLGRSGSNAPYKAIRTTFGRISGHQQQKHLQTSLSCGESKANPKPMRGEARNLGALSIPERG